jgi:vacuolar protein sorting-associated protein 52
MQKRLLPHLDNFLNSVNMLLWPKFQAIMGMHIDSLKKADPKKLITSKDPNVHFIVRRYAEFSSSILILNQGFEDGLLLHSLGRLRSDLESLLYRLAAEYPDKKLSLAFWINNMDCILHVLNQYSGPSFDPEKQFFENLYDEKSTEFVLFVIGNFLGPILQINDKHERKHPITKEMMEKCATDFQHGWKGWIAQIHDQIMAVFSNFQVGTKVLHLGLTQVVLQYKAFLGIWEEIFKQSKSKVGPIGIQSVLVEIKKFKSNY